MLRLPRTGNNQGVTLVELLIVIMIIGLLTTAALKAYDTSLQAGRFRSTMRTLNEISYAIVGNPDLITAGTRVDYGYVGDVGDAPEKLQDLVSPPSSIDSTLWRGPYVSARIAENPEGWMYDAWGDSLIYDPDSLTLASRRGMSILQPDSWITRRLARSRRDLFQNEVKGIVLDSKGNTPSDSILSKQQLRIVLMHPLEGRMWPESIWAPTGEGGNFTFNSVCVGNDSLFVRYVTATHDTHVVTKQISVAPGAKGKNWVEVHLTVPF